MSNLFIVIVAHMKIKHQVNALLDSALNPKCHKYSWLSIIYLHLVISVVKSQFDYFMYVTLDNPITSISTLYTFDIYQTVTLDIPANTYI